MRKLSLKKELLAELDTAEMARVAGGHEVNTLDSTCPCNSIWAVQRLIGQIKLERDTRSYCSH